MAKKDKEALPLGKDNPLNSDASTRNKAFNLNPEQVKEIIAHAEKNRTAETSEETVPETPVIPAPITTPTETVEQVNQTSNTVSAEWKSKIPGSYHQFFEAIPDEAKANFLKMLEDIDKPRQADYTKKTQSVAELRKEAEPILNVAKELGLPVEYVVNAVKAFNQLENTPNLKLVDVNNRVFWESKKQVPTNPFPDISRLNADETQAAVMKWHQTELDNKTKEIEGKVTNIVDNATKPLRIEEQKRRNDALNVAVKARHPDWDDETLAGAFELAKQAIEAYSASPKGDDTDVDTLDKFITPFTLAARAAKLGKNIGLTVQEQPESKPKLSSTDAPKTPGQKPTTKVKDWEGAVRAYKSEKGIHNLNKWMKE